MPLIGKQVHDTFAPYWAAGLILLIISGLLTININLGWFWKGYVLNICGPAWTYILFRGLFTAYKENKWIRFFTPFKTFIILLSVCTGIETLQYYEVYDSVFDPFDLAAYLSLLMPFYILDRKGYYK